MVHLHSTLLFTPDRVRYLPFPFTLTTTTLKCRSCGWFTTPACTAIVEDLPPSLIQLQYPLIFTWHTEIQARGSVQVILRSSISVPAAPRDKQQVKRRGDYINLLD